MCSCASGKKTSSTLYLGRGDQDHRRVGAQLTAYLGMSGLMSAVVISEQKNALMMESMLEVSGPFHSSYQGGLGLSVGKCKRTSADKRLGTLCVMHCEKSRRRDCLVVKLFFLTSLMWQSKKLEANVADPTG
jgi:hypothetical protein